MRIEKILINVLAVLVALLIVLTIADRCGRCLVSAKCYSCDQTGDGVVMVKDIYKVIAAYGANDTEGWKPCPDVAWPPDGRVRINDVLTMTANYGLPSMYTKCGPVPR